MGHDKNHATEHATGQPDAIDPVNIGAAPTAHDHSTLTTPVTAELWVDGGRGDTYVENGSITKPFKTIAAAEAVASAVTVIRVIRKSAHYIENLTITNASQIVGDGNPIIEGTIIFTGNPKSINRIQVIGDITCANVVVTFEQCEVIGKITTTGTGQVKYDGGILAPASGSAAAIGGAGFAINNALINVTGNVPGVDQSAGVVTLNNCLVFGASPTTEVVKSSGGQILISETVVQNLGGGAAISIPNGATTSPNILSNVTTVGNVVCGTAVTKVEGLTQATGTLTGSNIYFRPATMISNTPAGGIAATTVQAAINELDTDKANAAHTHEGTTIKSTGEVGGTKVLTEDGTGGASWEAPAGGNDPNAIHVNAAGEINGITAKTTLTGNDQIVLEDSADSNNKKKATITNLLKTKTSLQVGTSGAVSSGAGTFGYIIENDRLQAAHVGTGANQDGYMIYQTILPVDCDAVTNVRIKVKRFGSVDSFDLTVSKDGVADANMNALDILPVANDTLVESNITPASTYTAGNVLLIKFRSTCDNTEYAQVAECEITYRKKVVY
jgi:hypothetical protein